MSLYVSLKNFIGLSPSKKIRSNFAIKQTRKYISSIDMSMLNENNLFLQLLKAIGYATAI